MFTIIILVESIKEDKGTWIIGGMNRTSPADGRRVRNDERGKTLHTQVKVDSARFFIAYTSSLIPAIRLPCPIIATH